MIISGLEANKIKCILRPTSLFTSKATGLFNYTVLNCIDIYDVNLTISPLYRPITAEFTNRGFSVTYQHYLFINISNKNHYFTNYSTNNRPVSTNDHLKIKTSHLFNN